MCFAKQILRYAQYDVIFVILRAKTEESVQDFVTLNCLGFPVQKQVVRFTTFALTFVFVSSGLRSLRSHSPYANSLSWICFTKITSSVKIIPKCCFMVFYIRIWGKLRFLLMSRRTTGIGLSFRQPYIPLLQHLRRS